MSKRRMFHTDVVGSDQFLELSAGAQLIYFHLGMEADDDGFVNCPKRVCKKLNRPPRELKELVTGGFLLDFDGIMVIKHFRVANSLKNDRKKPLTYPEIAKQLAVRKNRSYTTDLGEQTPTLYDLREASDSPQNGIHPESQPNRTQPNRTEENRTEENQTKQNQKEENQTEGSRREGPDAHSAQLRLMGGTLGKGVVLLSDDQINSLLDRMGLDAFDHYVEKLAQQLIENKLKTKSHYATIMRWYLEDTEVDV